MHSNNKPNKFTLAILVEDKPTTLTRVSGLFARRNFNIHSLTVGEAEVKGISRITIVTDETSAPIEQIVSQLRRLIHILKVEVMNENESCSYEVSLIKINKSDGIFNTILKIKDRFNAIIVDETDSSMIIQISGDPEMISDFVTLLEPLGILELVKSGVITLSKGKNLLKNTYVIGEVVK